MKEIWEKNWVYDLIKVWADWSIRRSYRRFTVEGIENIPEGVPVILAPNHCCTLMDPLVVLLSRKEPTSFGARADIFKNPTAFKFLHLLRMVPLARARDGMKDVAGNYKTFDEITECIGHGIPFCMFVEGAHRPERGLQPIKNGIFKLSTIAEEKLGTPVQIVPVGIAYESFFDFMGDVVIRYGKPFTMAEYEQSELREALSSKIYKLQEDYPVTRPMPAAAAVPLALISLPLFVLAFVFSWPMLLASRALTHNIKDKAWLNTMRACSYFALVPILMLIMLGVMIFTCPWWATVASAVCLLLGHSTYYLLKNFYRRTIQTIKK